MKSVGTNLEVCKAFVNGYEGPNRNGKSNLFFEKDVLYSYGSHFPLCVRKVYRKKEFFLINGDKFSHTTSQHQYDIRSLLPYEKYCTVSVSAIRSIDKNRYILDELEIVDFAMDVYGWIDEENPLPTDLPEGTEISRDKNGNPKAYHRAGTLLFRLDDRAFLCGMDDGSYFVSKLPKRVGTIEKAYKTLKPKVTKEFKDEIFRQGEWFFMDLGFNKQESKKVLKSMDQQFKLPHVDNGNPHEATRGGSILLLEPLIDTPFDEWLMKLDQAKHFIVSGSIRHAQHRTLKLNQMDKPRLFLAAINTAVGNWSSSGMVD